MTKSYVTKKSIDKVALWKNKSILLNSLDIELTERCNNNCIHCYINLPKDDLEAKKKELTTQKIKDILKQAQSLGCLRVRFTGGEPLLREDFKDLYVFTRKLGIKVLIFTNATLITPELIKLFKKIPPLEKIEVTVYGMKKSSYESVTRIPGSYEKAFYGINLLLDNNIPFIVKGAFLPQNKRETDEFTKWARSIPWMEKNPSFSMFFDFRCRRDKNKNKLIEKIRVSPEEGVKFLTKNKKAFIKEMKQFLPKFTRPPGDKLFSCGSGKGGGCVDSYGNFQPCMLVRHPDTIYNINKGTLKEAVTEFSPKVREIRAENKEYLDRCGKCFLKGLCEMCPGKSYMEHGTLDTPVEYLCKITHLQAKYLGLIKDGEKTWEVINWRERIDRFVMRNS